MSHSQAESTTGTKKLAQFQIPAHGYRACSQGWAKVVTLRLSLILAVREESNFSLETI